MKDKRRFSLVLTAILTAVSILPCYAATTREKIDDAEARKKDNRVYLGEYQKQNSGSGIKKISRKHICRI